MKRNRIDTSSLVRISNKHIRKAKKLKKDTNQSSIGKVVEEALDYFDSAISKEVERNNNQINKTI